MELNNDYDMERSEIYRLFANLFMTDPSDEIITQMKDIFQMDFNDSMSDIIIDFTNIFLGPGKHREVFGVKS